MLESTKPGPSEELPHPRLRFINRYSGEIVDSIWNVLHDDNLWRHADFVAHEENTLKGAGDRSAWQPIFRDWFSLGLRAGLVCAYRMCARLSPHTRCGGRRYSRRFSWRSRGLFRTFQWQENWGSN